MTVLRSRKTLSSSPEVPTMETRSEPSTPAKTLDPSIASAPAHLGVSASAPPPRRSLRLAPLRSGDQGNPSAPNRKRMSEVRVTDVRLNKVRVSDGVGMGNRVVTGELNFQIAEGRDGVVSMVGEVALESFREGRENGVSDEHGDGERKLEVASEDLLDQGTLSLRSGKKVSKSMAGGSGGLEKVGIDEKNRVFCIGWKNIRVSDSDEMRRVVVGELDLETEEGREEVVTNVDQVTTGVTGSNFGLKSFWEARGNGMSDEKRQGKRKFGNVGGLRTLESVSKDCLDKGILSLRSGKKVMKRMVGVSGVFENVGIDEKAMVSDIEGKKLTVSAHGTGTRSVGAGELDSMTEEGREEVLTVVDEVTKGETGSTCLSGNGLSAEKGEGNLKWGDSVDLRTSELVSEGSLDKVSLSLRSGKKVPERIVEGSRGDVGQLVHDDNKEGGMTNKSNEYLGVVLDNVDLDCIVEIPVLVGLDKYRIDDDIGSGTRARRRLNEQEKGKGKMFDDVLVGMKEEKELNEDGGIGTVVEDGGLSNGIPVVKLDPEPNIGESTGIAVLVGHSLADVSIKHEGQVAETNTKANVMQGRVSKARFRDIAKKNASRFAHFTSEEVVENGSIDEAGREMPEMEAEKEVEDWPGPFSTAMKIIKDREMNVNVLQQNSSSYKSKPASLVWVPKEDHNRDSPKISIPSLQDICLAILAQNADAITSLDSVPDMLRHKLTKMLCDSRKMNGHFLDLLAQGSPSEIRISECSSLTEEQLVNAFEGCDASKLMVLQLDLCGRCMPDYVLRSTLARSPNSLPALTTISLNGAYRLSDAGLSGLVMSAPALRSINLSQCSLLTSDGIKIIADSLGSVLRELYINNCENIDAVLTLPALLKLENLEVLSMAGIGTVCDDFLGKFIAVQGRHIKELILTDCKKLTDASSKVIADNCKGLRALNLGNLHGLTDSTMGYLANGCRAIQSLKLCRNPFSDEAIAAYLEASGEALEDLSLCHINKVSYNTAVSLAKCSAKLLSLDLSWCRNLPDEALGLIVDSCLSLKELNLFGCTQVTDVFLDGHSNPHVQIIGLKTPILQNLKVPDPLEGPLHYSSVPS